MNEFLFVAIITGVAGLGYAIGWHFSHKATREYVKNLQRAIEESNKSYKRWQNSSAGKMWEQGRMAGAAQVINTMQAFLDRAAGFNDSSHDKPE